MEQTLGALPLVADGTGRSAASWPALFAGAVVAISLSLVLLALGAGLGFAAVSPWPGRGASATAFTVNAAIWLIVVQWLSASVGGYIAGRLRTKWVGTHTHEVFFRDTAHGLVTWSVATVFVAGVLASSASSLIGGGVHALASAAPAAASAAGGPGMPGAIPGAPSAATAYDIDKLFRSTGAVPGANANADNASDPRGEAVYIAFHAAATGSVSDADHSYLVQVVQAQTGVSSTDAQARVDEFISSVKNAEVAAKAAADTARKGAAEASIYTALSMLIGAFIASVSAALGGRLRDEHP